MDRLSEHAFIAKLSKHPILGSHTLMAPYVISKDQEKPTPEESTSSSTPKSSQESLTQIIEARLTNTKPVKEHMSKLWDELEHIVTGRKVDHNELKKKRKAGESSEEQPQVQDCDRYVRFIFGTQGQAKGYFTQPQCAVLLLSCRAKRQRHPPTRANRRAMMMRTKNFQTRIKRTPCRM